MTLVPNVTETVVSLPLHGDWSPADPGQMRVIKRDGHEVSYDPDKIFQAVARCMVSINWPEATVLALATQVMDQVDHILRIKARRADGGLDPINIEVIQNFVEIQLMGLGHHDAAKHYILYRDERRRMREESSKISPELRERFKEGCSYFASGNTLIRQAQYFDKFSRFDWNRGRREYWLETVDRTMRYFQGHAQDRFPGAVSEEIWGELRQGLLLQEATPSLRSVQMAGPALERCQVGVFSCAYTEMDCPESMAEDLYMLMSGVGVGFSVEEEIVDRWDRIKTQTGHSPVSYTVEDDTESWCDALKFGLYRWMDGGDVEFDLSLVRPKGAILRTKGGRASGPGPLNDLLSFSRSTILKRQGRKLRTIDVHDMTCMTHRIGQMGGVRRASGLSASSRDDVLMRHAKDGTFYNEHPYRNQANNSAVYEEKPTSVEFMEEWLSLAKSGSGERGIFNRGGTGRQNPKRRKQARWGPNPCGETILYRNFCNLSICIASTYETVESLVRKVRLATLWGTLQASMTRFRYLRPFWKENTDEEALLGVDILGHMDCNLLKPGAPGREALLQSLLREVQETNRYWAVRLGINPGAALTVCKPSGDSSVLFDKPAGFKAHHGRYYLRRMRFSQMNPVAKVLQEAGVPWEHEYDQSGNVVFEFPCQSPEGSIVVGDQSAIEQLENWKTWKVNFTEHNASCTVTVKDHEWIATGHWVYENWDTVGGLSFLPFDGGVYPQAPYQTLTEEEYNQRMAAMPAEIDWSRITLYEQSDMTELAGAFACTGRGCDS